MIAGLSAAVLAVAAVIAGASGHDPTNAEVLRGVKITQRISVAAVKRSNTSRDLLKQIQADPSDPDAGIAVPNDRIVHPAYFVVMAPDGRIERSTLDSVTASRTSPGRYLLTVGRDLSHCAWTATPQTIYGIQTSTSLTTTTTFASTSDFARGMSLTLDPNDPKSIEMRVTNDLGEGIDSALHMTIVC